MKKYLVAFLIFGSGFYLTASAQTLREFELKEITDNKVFALSVDYPEETAINIQTGITGLSFDSNTGGIVAIKTEQQRYILFMKPERQILTIRAPGYLELKVPLTNLAAKQTILYQLQPKESGYNPDKGTLSLQTQPAGARLTIDGFPGFEDYTPYIMENFEAKKYRIYLDKPGYALVDTVVEVKTGKRLMASFQLEPLFSVLLVKSSNTLRLMINDSLVVMKTPVQGIQVPPGEVKVVVDDPFFEPYSESMTLKLAETLEWIPDLKPAKGTISLVTKPSNARAVLISQNNTPRTIGFTPLKTSVPAGTYTLELTSDGYPRYTKDVTISRIQLTDLIIDLDEEMAAGKGGMQQKSGSWLDYWPWYAGGAVVVGGTAVLLMSGSSKKTGNSSTQLPLPPGRP